MHHIQLMTVSASLCCFMLSACQPKAISLPAPTESQLLNALQRMNPSVQSIQLEKCTHQLRDAGIQGTLDLWTCRTHVQIQPKSQRTIHEYVDVNMHLVEYHDEGWMIDWVDFVKADGGKTYVH